MDAKSEDFIDVSEAKAWLVSHEISNEDAGQIIGFLDKGNSGSIRYITAVKLCFFD